VESPVKKQSHFYFMATILERFDSLGLPKNKSQLSWAGERVSLIYCKSLSQGRKYKSQEEQGETLKVWDYPEEFTSDIDLVIKSITQNG